ncbi:MAG: LVIVD repeat-containing protein [Thermoplasmatota archaeon]
MAALLAGLLAGCTSTEPEGSDAQPITTGRPALIDGFPPEGELLGFERLASLATPRAGTPANPYNLALGEDLLLASVGNPAGGLVPPMDLAVFDASDPAQARLVSQVSLPGGGVESVAVTPDDAFGFLGTEFSGGVGIWVVDLTDPAQPVPVGYTPIATEGPHNIRYASFGGQEYLLASISHVATPLALVGFPQDPLPVVDLRVDLFRFDRASPETPMELVSSYQAVDPAGDERGVRLVHDAVHQTHPVTGQELMYVAHWDAGVRIVDITDPAAPQEIGVHADPAPTDFLIIHTVKPHPGLLGGRHITVATSQCAYAPDSPCHLRILDTTDPANITQIATWELPDGTHGSGLTSEIFDLRDGLAVVPWGGAGTWALDITDPTAPVAFGYDRVPGFANAAALKGDVAFVADAQGGLDVLRLPN